MKQRLWRHLCAALAILAALLGAGTPPASSRAPSARAAAERPVMAFYYPWYEPSDWTYDTMSDLPAPTYSGGDDATLRRHIRQADAAGITALICTWYGPTERRLDGRCRRLMQLIRETGSPLRVALIPDQAAAFDPAMRTPEGLAAALGVLRRDFASHPAYFTFRGRPAVFWFDPPSLGGVGDWQRVRALADPQQEQYWFGSSDNFAYLDAFDALYYYDITWEGAPGAAMASYAGRLANFNARRGEQRPFIGTVMPGYDDLRVRPDGHRRDRGDGAYYRGTWQDAIDYDAEAVVLTSFNEFFEGTYVEPSEKYGDLYLRLTREGSDRYRGVQPSPSAPPDQCRAFPETGQQVCGRFLAHWQAHGGLAINGYPLSGEFTETLENGQTYTVQYFERVRLEHHPEVADPQFQVLLGQFGRRLHPAEPPVGAITGMAYFPETGHNVPPDFVAYWTANGGLPQFGYPLSEVFRERLEDGREYEVQYFERARFERHPENPAPYKVQLGQFGRAVCGQACR